MYRVKLAEIINQLKGRVVLRSTITYAVIAAGTIDVAGNALPSLGLPQWTVTMVVLIALMGFPLTVLIAWNIEKNQSPATRRARWTRNSLFYAAPLLVLVAAYLVARRPIFAKIGADAPVSVAPNDTASAAPRVPPASIAVLPFVDLSPKRDHEYFSEGITEELTTALSLLPGVKVAARTSASEFKNKGANITEIARRLGVATVLEGSVRRAGESLRVTAQWIDARDGYHLWAHNFDARLTDVFAIQDSIANAVAQALGTRLAQLDNIEGSSRATHDAVAYDLYLKGRHLERKGDSASVAKAVEVLNQALKRDPAYTIAYRSLAGAYTKLAQAGDTTAYAKARAATARAQKIAIVTAAVNTPAANDSAVIYNQRVVAALAIGDRAAAIKAVEEGIASGALTVADLKRDTIYDPLRKSIRFVKLLTQ